MWKKSIAALLAISLTVFFVGVEYAVAALPENASLPQSGSIVGRWYLDEASGTRADSSGNGNTLTDNNTVGSAAGQFDETAADFESTNSEYLSDSDNTSVNFGVGNFTISFWANVESNGTSGSNYHTVTIHNNNNNPRVMIQVLTTRVDGQFYDGTNGANASKTGMSNTGNWIHVTFARDGGNAKLFIGGTLESTNSSTFGTPASANLTLNDVYLGRSILSTIGYYDGLMQDLVIWDAALSDEEVSDLYDAYFASSPGIKSIIIVFHSDSRTYA